MRRMTLFQNAGCSTAADSSWHGTKVAGVIGAATNNGIGVAGIAPATMLLPIRAIGVCTGRVSDIAAAITWAYGGSVTGVPTNAHPANIINLSLGAAEACSATEQAAVSAAIAANVLVVAAAGNAGGPVNAPANCNGVLSVAGIREAGTKVGYSSLSSTAAAVTIAAPAGNCINIAVTQQQPTAPASSRSRPRPMPAARRPRRRPASTPMRCSTRAISMARQASKTRATSAPALPRPWPPVSRH